MAEKTLQAEGYTFQLRSYVFDGLVYINEGGDNTLTVDLAPEKALSHVPIEQVFKDVVEWTRATFTTATPTSVADRTINEAAEFANAAKIISLAKKFGISLPAKAVLDEMADLHILMYDFCAINGISFMALVDGIRDKLEELKGRIISEPDEHNQRHTVYTEEKRTCAEWMECTPDPFQHRNTIYTHLMGAPYETKRMWFCDFVSLSQFATTRNVVLGSVKPKSGE